ncbi:aspartate carbamoyltransferase regulatory subunit [Dolosicoccus paucivorans]|uniref:Aspartate carbamoyltransferase regulatory subunit n=1 Tax=Dolosicoccus paucivorans TaxID=84521 RepID=A0A2N6SM20_9LACT|nr:aspartate carbamoyltransferase regulatory subunit [Dolosicoccus paucivorans]PMB83918.1 aspartate carbamoyltransferase regulatory subunit [Dolosicoccus paucivorans]PMC58125.1 aspartate carbamoyltransferase regulatory subunit [Dolosicoccus paucivorans]
MMRINSIRSGIVIDHIPAGLGPDIFNLLELNKADYTVALIMNAQSDKMGQKDMIKIENQLNVDLSILGVFGEGLTINVIDEESIVHKVTLELPEQIHDILSCNNPRCISTVERNVEPSFTLVNPQDQIYRCDYCDHLYYVKEELHAHH